MNVVRAATPWATGMSGTNWSRGRREAGNGSASSSAIISSVTVSSVPGGDPREPPGSAGTHPPSPPLGSPPLTAPDPRGAGTTTGYGVHRVTVQTPRAMAPAISMTPSQASGSQPVLMNPSQIRSPVRATLA